MIRLLIFAFIYVISLFASYAQIKSEEISLSNGVIELPGTLSYVSENKPLIIWIHGSGNVDRNGNQGKLIQTNYIQQFREAVNSKEIAFFSYDKRTSNEKNFPHLKNISFKTLVDDVNIVLTHFKESNRFSKIILVGHSQGSLIGALLANKVDQYISLAGPADSIDQTIITQIQKNAPMLSNTTIKHFKELKETGTIKEVNPMLNSIFAKQNLPFISSWMKYNPTEEFKKIKVPVLLINGDKDLQVSITDAEKLHSKTANGEIKIIQNMNHILKDIQKDEFNKKSYFDGSYPISKQLITEIVSFIEK